MVKIMVTNQISSLILNRSTWETRVRRLKMQHVMSWWKIFFNFSLENFFNQSPYVKVMNLQSHKCAPLGLSNDIKGTRPIDY
jgi:hypothetical protein